MNKLLWIIGAVIVIGGGLLALAHFSGNSGVNQQASTNTTPPISAPSNGLDCGQYVSAGDISSIFGVTGVNVTVDNRASTNNSNQTTKCAFYWTSSDINRAGFGVYLPNDQAEINDIKNDCAGKMYDSQYAHNLHSENIGDVSCYYGYGLAPAINPHIEFIKDDQAVQINGTTKMTEAQLVQLATLIANKI